MLTPREARHLAASARLQAESYPRSDGQATVFKVIQAFEELHAAYDSLIATTRPLPAPPPAPTSPAGLPVRPCPPICIDRLPKVDMCEAHARARRDGLCAMTARLEEKLRWLREEEGPLSVALYVHVKGITVITTPAPATPKHLTDQQRIAAMIRATVTKQARP